jgi:predicted NAD/FAD-dependent oxidoreductase
VKFTGHEGAADAVLQPILSSCNIPVFSLMVAFPQHLESVPFDAACTEGAPGRPFEWVSRESSKPGRGAGDECWVAVTTPHRAEHILRDLPLHIGTEYNPQSAEYRKAVADVLVGEFLDLLRQFQV